MNSHPQVGSAVWSKFGTVFATAAKNLLRNPTRSAVVVLCLTAVLSPFITAIAISEGIREQYSSLLKAGADLYVTEGNYGSNAPIHLDRMERLRSIQGVSKVVPRVIGRTYIRGKLLAVLGIDTQHSPKTLKPVRGRMPTSEQEVALGHSAAEYLNVQVGDELIMKRNPDTVFRIVGLFRSENHIRNADLVLMSFGDASRLFNLVGKATDMLVYTRPGYEQVVAAIVRSWDHEKEGAPHLLRVQTRSIVHRYSQRGFGIKAGVFSGFYCLVFLLAIPCLGVISGFGLSERQREIGVMKALGWQTREVLHLVATENFLLSVISVPPAIAASIVWIHGLNGMGIAQFFVANLAILIPFKVPAEIFPIPAVLAAMMAVILTMVGSIYSTWKTATVPPSEAMRM